MTLENSQHPKSSIEQPMKAMYLIRHGQTEYNRLGLVQGSGVDADLNETGREQARRFFMRFAGEGFKKVYTSGLRRTHQSVEKFIEMGIPWEQHPGLNEISWGDKEGKAIDPLENQVYFQYIERWAAGETDLPFEGGESPDHVSARMAPVIAHLLTRPEEDKILVCMHGRAMRILLCQLLGYPLSCMEGFDHRNLCLYKLIHTGGTWHIELFNYLAEEHKN